MKQTKISPWQYSIQQFNKLAEKKSYAIRFRLEYAFLLMSAHSISAKAKIFVKHLLAYFNQLRFIFSNYGKLKTGKNYDIIFLVSDNKAYLQHLVPVIETSIEAGKNILILTPAKEFSKLKNKLPGSIFQRVHICESLDLNSGISTVIKALFLSVADVFWFMFRDIKIAFWFSTAFGRYALIQKTYETSILKLLKNTKHLIGANDHWMWESLFFKLAKKVETRSIVIQHGVTGEFTYPVFADFFAAWGEADIEKLIAEQGAKPGEMKAAGSPYFNNIYSKITAGRNPKAQIEKPCITFLAQPFKLNNILVKEYQEILKHFYTLAYMAKNLGKELVIKIHPMENVDDYRHFSEHAYISAEPLYDVLDRSCIVFTVDSTSIFEAVMFGIPAYQVFEREQERQIDFFSRGVTSRIFTDDDIISETASILSTPEKYFGRQQKAFEALNFYFSDIGENNKDFLDKLLRN